MGISQTPQALVPASFSSGGMTLLQSMSLSGTSVTSSTLSSSYKMLIIYIKDLYGAAQQALNMRLNNDSGNNYNYNYTEGTTTLGPGSNNATAQIRIGTLVTTTTARQKFNGIIEIMTPSDTDNVLIKSMGTDYNGSAQEVNFSIGVYDSSAAITSITIYAASSMTAGTAYIYGVN